SEVNPDLILANVNGEGLQIVAFIIETSSALQIEAPAVPVAGENAVPDRPAGQGIAHVRALVVGRVDPAVDVEERDAAPFSEPDGFRLTPWNVARRGHAYPLRCMFGHDNLLPSDKDIHFKLDAHSRTTRAISTNTSSSRLRERLRVRKPWSAVSSGWSVARLPSPLQTVAWPASKPAVAPSSVNRKPSTSDCRSRRPRLAPSARRSAVSLARDAARAMSRLATLTQAIIKRMPTPAKSASSRPRISRT